MLIATHPQIVLVAMAYAYLASAFIGMAVTRFGIAAAAAGRGTPRVERPPTRDADVAAIADGSYGV